MKRNDFGVTSGSSTQPQYKWSVSGMSAVKDGTKGAWVSAGFAISRIAELEADRDKWRNECLDANESERKLFQRQAELEAEVARLRSENKRKDYEFEMHSSLAEHARVQRDTAWNDAIKAAANVTIDRQTRDFILSLRR